ncbi:MAG: hypothetical protein KGJ13_09945 [Patescibacteria group bacterium]|nr:hypothetical protein [Patescibacteria group bacterium]
MAGARTTESLRASLFDAIDAVKAGKMDAQDANAICNLAEKIIKSASLEIQYALTCSKLDAQGQGVSPGKLLLTSDSGK